MLPTDQFHSVSADLWQEPPMLGQTQMKHFEHPQEQRNLEEPIRKAKEDAAKVTSRTEVLQSLQNLLTEPSECLLERCLRT